MTCRKIAKNQKFTKSGVVSAAIAASRKTGKGMRGYFCPEHKCYHLTTKTKEEYSAKVQQFGGRNRAG